jgi:hypothetical protein
LIPNNNAFAKLKDGTNLGEKISKSSLELPTSGTCLKQRVLPQHPFNSDRNRFQVAFVTKENFTRMNQAQNQ